MKFIIDWIRERWQTRHDRMEKAHWSHEVDKLAKRLEFLALEHEDVASQAVSTFMSDHPSVAERNFFSIWPKDQALVLCSQMGEIIAEIEAAIYGEG